ncbi:hypothetical protein BT96DRAFT_836392, partial [Gymnopus androsaceus JB14]
LFPWWLGCFNGSRPSLAGMDKYRVIIASESRVMTESDVASLLYLIRLPDLIILVHRRPISLPSLPFHSLISILAKFPADINSRVFWTSSLHDLLFNAVFTAIQVLIVRIEQRENENDNVAYPPNLVDALTRVALDYEGMFLSRSLWIILTHRVCSLHFATKS